MRCLLIVAALLVATEAVAASSGVRLSGSKISAQSVGGGGGPPVGSSCTDGVDCLCDRVTTSSPLLFCEDFESDELYAGTAANFWAATQTGTGNRGDDSYWWEKYGNTSGGGFRSADGAPYIDQACTAGSECVGSSEYCSSAQGALLGLGADCWGPGSNARAYIDMQREGDFDAEVASLTLVGGAGSAPDVGGGNTHFAERVPPGSNAGFMGFAFLKTGGGGTSGSNTDVTEIGLTMALAYSPNILTETDSVMGYNGGAANQWKHDEWGGANSEPGGAYEHFNLGNTGCGGLSDFPYRGFMFHTSGESACDTEAASGVIITEGAATCNGAALQMCATDKYDISQSDSPIGRWTCHQAHIRGLGTTDMDIEIKHNGVTVFKMENFDGTLLRNQSYDRFGFNAYSNRNQDDDGTSNDTDVTQYRYEDEILVVNGPPEPCSVIGY